jgi:hypothetical protein
LNDNKESDGKDIGGHSITPFFFPVFMNLAIFSLKKLQGCRLI